MPDKEYERFNKAAVSYVKSVDNKVNGLTDDFEVIKKYLNDKGYLKESILDG